MPKISEAFPSKYLKASDLAGKEPVVTIADVLFEEVGKEREKKLVVYFQKRQKGMILNKGNSEKLAHKFGDDTADWHGQDVQLYTEMVNFNGQRMEGLRLRPVAAASAPSDEVPF
jgi:hypothetical protein